MLEVRVRSQVSPISHLTFLTVLVGRELTGCTTARYLTVNHKYLYCLWAQLNLDQPVCRHEYEGVDGDVGRDVDDVLDCPAPGQTKGPEHQDVVTGRGRDTNLSYQGKCYQV